MTIRLSTYLCIAFMLASCVKKKDPASELPPPTTTGQMTFGCVLNDNTAYSVHGPVIVTYSFGLPDNYGISAMMAWGGLQLQVYEFPTNLYNVNMSICDTVLHPGKYVLGQVLDDSAHNLKSNVLELFFIDGNGKNYYYQTDSFHTGQLILTRCSDSIYSGTFSATLGLPGTTKTMSVTAGRFDIKLK